MASYGEGYEGQKHHGNDEYGNPVQHTTGGTTGERGIKEKITEKLPGGHKQEQQTHTTPGGTTGEHGMHGHGTGATTGKHGVAQKLQRSGSSSSSSSEDDGMGGRRKKGITEKIKEKLPGGHKQEQQTHTTTGEYGATGIGEQPYEKKGMMDKVKDKLPGAQH